MTNPEMFPDYQDAFIVGKIISLDNEVFTVNVLKSISGSTDSENILVDMNFHYLGFSEETSSPVVGDFCILSIKKYDDIYKAKDRAVKADSGDYQTLKCLYESIHFAGGDVPAIQWYVNSGGTENGFGFGSGKAYVTRPNGEIVEITDISIKLNSDQSLDSSGQDAEEPVIENPETGSDIDYIQFAFGEL